jgi:hypothetical protein
MKTKQKHLTERPKNSKVLRSLAPRLTVSIKTLDAEQTTSSKQKAIRLFCRAMIRLHLQDHGNPENGKRLGVL